MAAQDGAPNCGQGGAWDDYHKDCARQVDHYFSADTLIGDVWLLEKMKGRQNLPVPVAKIASCQEMLKYDSVEQIIFACKKYSQQVNVVVRELDGVFCLQRKEIFKKDEERARRGLTTKGTDTQTGFEGGYKEWVNEEDQSLDASLYHPSKDIVERIETAIQRYANRRKMILPRRKVFQSFLVFGGCFAGPKPFSGGLDRDYIDTHDALDVAAMTNAVYIGADTLEGAWKVDFEGVVRGWFSGFAENHFRMHDTDVLDRVVSVPRALYRYLDVHNVCPEPQYHTSLMNALAICDTAKEELPKVLGAAASLPGPFSVACSTLFGGYYKSFHPCRDESDINIYGMTNETARNIFATACTIVASDDQWLGASEKNAQRRFLRQSLVRSREMALEVIKIELPSDTTREAFKGVVESRDWRHVKPLGKLYCRTWNRETAETYDGPALQVEGTSVEEFVFFLEDNILDEYCFRGMKIVGTVYELSMGWHYLDSVTWVGCSFATSSTAHELSQPRKTEVVEYTPLEMLEYQKRRELEDDEGVQVEVLPED